MAVTVSTVLHNMFFGIALIFLIQWVFLGNLRCALIVSATIPVALLLAVMITVARGESANLLSVGAIDALSDDTPFLETPSLWSSVRALYDRA